MKEYTFNLRINIEASVSHGAPVVGLTSAQLAKRSISSSFVVMKMGGGALADHVAGLAGNIMRAPYRQRASLEPDIQSGPWHRIPIETKVVEEGNFRIGEV